MICRLGVGSGVESKRQVGFPLLLLSISSSSKSAASFSKASPACKFASLATCRSDLCRLALPVICLRADLICYLMSLSSCSSKRTLPFMATNSDDFFRLTPSRLCTSASFSEMCSSTDRRETDDSYFLTPPDFYIFLTCSNPLLWSTLSRES